MNYVIAASRPGYEKIVKNLSSIFSDANFILISEENDLELSKLKEISPRYVFFPHWSYIIPKNIYSNFECIIFHMTDLPFGRGGSPLQNLISRGIYETKISAIRCEKEIDGGPIYAKRNFSLYGTAEEIYMRAAQVIEEMIIWIIKNNPQPVKQKGEVVRFRRRKPDESNIKDVSSLDKLYDYIRMLDAEGYPRAYLETEYFRFEFQRASLKKDYIIADVIIKEKKKG